MQNIIIENQFYTYATHITENGQLHHDYFLPKGHPTVPSRSEMLRFYPYEVSLSFAESHRRGWRFGDTNLWDEASHDLVFQSYKTDGPLTVITLQHNRLNVEVQLCYVNYEDSPALQRYTRIINRGEHPLELQHVSSFILSGFPYFGNSQSLSLHSFTSGWACEGEQRTEPFTNLGLFAPGCRSSWSFQNNSAFSTHRRFPYFVIEERESELFWGVQIESGSQWRVEIGGGDTANPDWFYMQGGLLNYTGSLWSKQLQPEEVFETPKASMTVAADRIDRIYNQMHIHQLKHFIHQPKEDQRLPVIFNDWQALRGDVSEQRIHDMLQDLQDAGVEIYVTDSGWYHEDDQDWSEYVGCWKSCDTRFPNGLSPVAKDICKHGMIPGIWCEIEMVGPHSPHYNDPNMVLTCNEQFITQGHRRFLNFGKQEVRDFASGVVEQIYSQGFRYLKIDYNADCTPGCDGEDRSIVENLRQARIAYGTWLAGILEKYPDLILEHCASGGMKLDYDNLTRGSLASITDQWNYRHTGSILCNITKLVHPIQCQNWSTLKPEMDDATMEFVLTNSMMGRMCISGFVTRFSNEQKNIVKKSIDFYKRYRKLIQNPSIYYHTPPRKIQDPDNIKIMEYLNEDWSMVYISTHNSQDIYSFTPEIGPFEIIDQFPNRDGIKVSGNTIAIDLPHDQLFGRILILKKK